MKTKIDLNNETQFEDWSCLVNGAYQEEGIYVDVSDEWREKEGQGEEHCTETSCYCLKILWSKIMANYIWDMISNENESPDNENKCSLWFLGYTQVLSKNDRIRGNTQNALAWTS